MAFLASYCATTVGFEGLVGAGLFGTGPFVLTAAAITMNIGCAAGGAGVDSGHELVTDEAHRSRFDRVVLPVLKYV